MCAVSKQPDFEQRQQICESREAKPTAYWMLVVVVLVLLSEETAYAVNLVAPALPDMAARLGTAQIAWVSTLFSLVGGVTAPLVGKLADIHGKKRVLLCTAVVTALGSAVVALASSFWLVLVGQVMAGVAISILPLSYSIMRDILPTRLVAIGASVAVSGLGLTGIVAPLIAGYLIDHFTYRGVFVFLTIFPLVLATLITVIVPESPVRLPTRLDWFGALLLGTGFGLLLAALSEGPSWGWGSVASLGCLVGTAVLLVAWAGYENRVTDPLLPIPLLRSRALCTTSLAQFTAQGVIVLHFILLSFLVQTPRELGRSYGLGGSATTLAAYTAPGAVISVLMGFLVGFIARRRGARTPLAVGFVFAAAGSAVLAFAHTESWSILTGFLVFAVGAGMVNAAIPNQVIAAVSDRQQAVSAGTVTLVGSLGAGIFVQFGFAFLPIQRPSVISGKLIYSGAGFVWAYIFAVIAAIVGLCSALLMRHGRRPLSDTTP